MVNKGRVGLLVAALRSGLYEKGEHKLHQVEEVDGEEKHTWCCLGVGSDVAIKFGLTGVQREMKEGFAGNMAEAFDGNDSYMCPKVMDWFGFEGMNPRLKTREGAYGSDAARLNDCGEVEQDGSYHELDFGQIAQYFEDTYLK